MLDRVRENKINLKRGFKAKEKCQYHYKDGKDTNSSFVECAAIEFKRPDVGRQLFGIQKL